MSKETIESGVLIRIDDAVLTNFHILCRLKPDCKILSAVSRWYYHMTIMNTVQ